MTRQRILNILAVLEWIGMVWATIDRLFNRIFRKRDINAVIGQGEFRYKVQEFWGVPKNPQDYPVRDCHEMVKDKNNNLYLLTNHPKNNILIYNLNGDIIGSWTLGLDSAHGLTIASEGDKEFLYICAPYSATVLKTDLAGNVLMRLPPVWELNIGIADNQYFPTQTAIADNGDIYVADGYGSSFIFQFAKDGKYIRHFGGKGKAEQNVNNAHGICIDKRAGNPTILVSAREDCCFKRFTLEGEYLETIALPGAYVCRPVIHKEELYAGACWSNMLFLPNTGFVTILDKSNNVVSVPGGKPAQYINSHLQKLKQDQKIFQHCHDVCVDDDDNIYVCQWNANGLYPMKLERIR